VALTAGCRDQLSTAPNAALPPAGASRDEYTDWLASRGFHSAGAVSIPVNPRDGSSDGWKEVLDLKEGETAYLIPSQSVTFRLSDAMRDWCANTNSWYWPDYCNYSPSTFGVEGRPWGGGVLHVRRSTDGVAYNFMAAASFDGPVTVEVARGDAQSIFRGISVFAFDGTSQVEVWTNRPPPCDLLADPAKVQDSVLRDANVQAGLKTLWRNSNPHDSIANRREQGAFIVWDHQTGQLKLTEFATNQSPRMCESPVDVAAINSTFANGDSIVGYVHTHPHHANEPVPTDGSCAENRRPDKVFGDGPSRADRKLQQTSGWPAYVFDFDHIHRLRPFQRRGRPETINRAPNCE
jgi:hypothetical protein